MSHHETGIKPASPLTTRRRNSASPFLTSSLPMSSRTCGVMPRVAAVTGSTRALAKARPHSPAATSAAAMAFTSAAASPPAAARMAAILASVYAVLDVVSAGDTCRFSRNQGNLMSSAPPRDACSAAVRPPSTRVIRNAWQSASLRSSCIVNVLFTPGRMRASKRTMSRTSPTSWNPPTPST